MAGLYGAHDKAGSQKLANSIAARFMLNKMSSFFDISRFFPEFRNDLPVFHLSCLGSEVSGTADRTEGTVAYR